MGKDGLFKEGWMIGKYRRRWEGVKQQWGCLKTAIRNPIINYLLTKYPIMNAMHCIKIHIHF